jgi:hypothetical protein
VRGSTRGALRAPKEDEEARSRREELVVRFISPLAQIIEFESWCAKNRKRKAKKNSSAEKGRHQNTQEEDREDNQGVCTRATVRVHWSTDHRFRVCCT